MGLHRRQLNQTCAAPAVRNGLLWIKRRQWNGCSPTFANCRSTTTATTNLNKTCMSVLIACLLQVGNISSCVIVSQKLNSTLQITLPFTFQMLLSSRRPRGTKDPKVDWHRRASREQGLMKRRDWREQNPQPFWDHYRLITSTHFQGQ